MNKNLFDWGKARQLSVIQLLLATFLPSAVAFIGFHVVLPVLVKNGTPVLIAWPVIASVMLLAFVVTAILFLRREAKAMGISLWARMCLKKLSLKEWIDRRVDPCIRDSNDRSWNSKSDRIHYSQLHALFPGSRH
jgi:hypothetical protein